MSSIDTGKVIAGGVLAGVVLAGFDYVSNNYILAKDWQNVAQVHNIDMALTGQTSAMLTFIAVDFVLGLLVVFTYAAIRPRFGPGIGTAAIAAFLLFLTSALVNATLAGVFYPWDLYIRATALGLAAFLVAGVSGAWVYSEKEEEEDSGV